MKVCRTNVLSRARRPLWTVGLLGLVAGVAVLLSMSWTSAATARPSQVPTGHSADEIHVKLVDGTPMSSIGTFLPTELRRSVTRVSPLFGLPPQALAQMRSRAQQRSGKAMPDLRLWLRLRLRSGTDVQAFIAALEQLEDVESAELAPLPQEPPAITPSFVDNQGYLEPASDGIDAALAWDVLGGAGAGVMVYDVEYSWNQSHEDLSKVASIGLLLNTGDTAVDPFSNNDHGTAVIGQLIADKDAKGVTGIVWDADIGVAPANTSDLGYNPGNAILLAVADGQPGDVILIEQQTGVCGLAGPCAGPGGNCGPTEWIQSAFDAIQTATSSGFIVVEAAGNGGVDLDQEGCDGKFDRSVRDSGAIIVGAGAPPGSTDRERLGFSSYGSRVDLQGWGDSVMTTGYGVGYVDTDDPTNPDRWYTDRFGGTSSASPIVTGAVAAIQGAWMAHYPSLAPLTSDEIRQLLVDTGSPQQGTTAEQIGPRPDLEAALAALVNVAPRADAGDDQVVECEGHTGTAVALDGTGSRDANDDTLTYTWTGPFTEGGGTATGATPTVTLADGTHTLQLRVDDGNGETDTDTVLVMVRDTTPPVVTLIGASELTLECAIDTYSEQGATVTDTCDASPTLAIDDSALDLTTTGDYGIVYTGRDAAAKVSSVTRTVQVVDTTAPSLTLIGASDITLECGVDTYTDPGATAVDACEGALAVTSSGTVDVSTPGTYTISYSVTDSDGNLTTAERTVRVLDTTAPSLTAGAGPTTLWPPDHMYRTLSLSTLGLTVTDACDATLSSSDVLIPSATSDEADDARGAGDGFTTNDILIGVAPGPDQCRTVELRAERSSNRANGRVYTLNLAVADDSGNVGWATHEVHVPVAREVSPLGVNDGAAYAVSERVCMP